MMLDDTLIEEYQSLFDIDANLNRLVKKIELLNYINPLNIESEKKQFFASKYKYEPNFKYPKLKFNGYKLHRLFYSQRLERIEDDDIRQLYEDIIYEYSGLIECIETINQGRKFYFNSLKSFGTPTEKDIDNAKFILRLMIPTLKKICFLCTMLMKQKRILKTSQSVMILNTT